MSDKTFRIRGARQNNLKGIDIDIPLGELIVVTGVSGSGKSSFAFDTVYAEGQRRYVETFSPYARQFLDRMDRPKVDRIEGIPPSIAINQSNPVRTSRSTVGTMTELNDHLKLLFARAAHLHCRSCGLPVRLETSDTIYREIRQRITDHYPYLEICFTIPRPDSFTLEEMTALLSRQGYTRTRALELPSGEAIEVVQDRTRLAADRKGRIIEALEIALQRGHGSITVYPLDRDRQPATPLRFSQDLHCPECDIHYRDPQPNLFSFNSALGACEQCRGFGRTIGIDWSLVVPNPALTLKEGAIRPFQSGRSAECQEDLLRGARRRKIPLNTPWQEMQEDHRQWVLKGEGERQGKRWYGVEGYFSHLESRSYKMHIRVLLSKYRCYAPCSACQGARLKDEVLDYRLGSVAEANAVLPATERFRSHGVTMDEATYQGLPGLNIHDVVSLPLQRLMQLFTALRLPKPLDKSSELLLDEIRSRLRYLNDVGLGYLTLDRQSRTLSGGEVQRINLTTALGTSLVNTLFVLDEPSIGLHPRDIGRINGVLRRLCEAGNTLLVVEHDPQIMLAADRIIDIGPGPGEAGGEVIFYGTPRQLLRSRHSLTADYLSGRRGVIPAGDPTTVQPGADRITIRNARAHNLKGIDVAIPLGCMVTLTGVSGSGKSTLVNDLLYNALTKIKGQPREEPGAHDAIEGAELIDGVVLLDQAPVGKSSRSNPVSYVGAWDAIRRRLAATETARSRDYTPGTFSFNSGNGRCPTCSGSGFEHIEMQFLSDVYLRCPDCNGSRYRSEILKVRLPTTSDLEHGVNVAELLEMTVDDAITLFRNDREVSAGLYPLCEVGLGYLRLGQPVPTLSGGEAQRLKLAGYLARGSKRQRRGEKLLLLLDEPTTGLHFNDIAVLIGALRRLLKKGHSLLIIEHNLDLIEASDWLIELGPEGGEDGGELICEGSPDEIASHPSSHTGEALRGYRQQPTPTVTSSRKRRPRSGGIEIRNACEHNLKNLTLTIPREKFTVISGISGSGKSTIAFDILFNEGQRRYLESLNAYARQFVQPAARAEVDAVFGIPPTVAIEQRTSRGGHKSTVGTLTEIHHFLRLLFVKLGSHYCPECEIPIEPQSRDQIYQRLSANCMGDRMVLLAPLVVARKGLYNELARWANRKGYPLLRVDGELLPCDNWPALDRYHEHNIDLPVGELLLTGQSLSELRPLLDTALDFGKGTIRVARVAANGRWVDERHYSTQRTCPGCGRGFAEPDPRLFSYNSKHGWCESCHGVGHIVEELTEEQSGEEGIWLEAHETQPGCPKCQGARLNPEALAVYFRERNIADYSTTTIDEAITLFNIPNLTSRERAIGEDLLKEIRERLSFLRQIGLGYLTLDRGAPTLSGGEAQRIRLAAQLGTNLRGVCYVLDEPTIGLHPRDNNLLLNALTQLRDKGNTIVVVEHDEQTILSAEHVIDIGPGAGVNGGELVHQGSVKSLLRNRNSLTGRCLARPADPLTIRRTRGSAESCLQVHKARLNNLKEIDAELPLQRLVAVTGVSGSGKSTLIREVIGHSLRALLTRGRQRGRIPQHHYHGCQQIEGWQELERVLEVDQSPIGKTPRSCPATYVGFWDPIRRLYAETEDARIHGWAAGRFSFNSGAGRCEECRGQGMKRVAMNFLPDVKIQCEECLGERFNSETLAVRYRGKNIGELLTMSVDEAVGFFAAHPKIHHPLTLLQDVGLGYLTLGQQSPTLSGGEAQRIRLVSELAKARPEARNFIPTLYLLDEPTVGLHMADVERLVTTLHRLVDAGHSVIVIEHNLDLIAAADWVVDMGPEGGAAGGQIVTAGPPSKLTRATRRSHTGKALKAHLDRLNGKP